MPWIVLIDDPNTAEKKSGDLVGVYRDEHIFSASEQALFNIHRITGFTRDQVVRWLQDNTPEVRTVYRSAVADEWTVVEPEKKRIWNDSGTWRFLEATPKYGWNFGAFTAQDAAMMADGGVTNAQKIALWEAKIEFRFRNLPENQMAVS